MQSDQSETMTPTTAAPGSDAAAMRSLLATYAAALTASDTDAIRAEYDEVLRLIRLRVSFDVAEVLVTNPQWAFARTNSAGRVNVHSTGAESAEGNQRSFDLHKSTDAAWRIGRYCLSPIKPPAHP